MKQRPHSLFCPFCNAKGSKQPVLSPMVVRRVDSAPIEQDGAVPTPFFLYRCERCGYGEIHAVKTSEAA